MVCHKSNSLPLGLILPSSTSDKDLHAISLSLCHKTISLTNSLIALTCGIIGSIELYFGIQKRLENHLISQRDYYLLSIDIYKTLSLDKPNRPIPAKDFLEKSYNIYTKLIESSSTLAKVKGDKLIPINVENDIENIVLTPIPPKRGRVDIFPNNIDLSSTDD